MRQERFFGEALVLGIGAVPRPRRTEGGPCAEPIPQVTRVLGEAGEIAARALP